MFPAIRLFARSVCSWKSDSVADAHKEIDNFFKDNIKHHIQDFKHSIVVTNRKRSPFNVEVSYYDWQTIGQMVNHFE